MQLLSSYKGREGNVWLVRQWCGGAGSDSMWLPDLAREALLMLGSEHQPAASCTSNCSLAVGRAPGAARQLVASPSGSGYGHSTCPDGVPVELALLTLLAAFGVAFGVLYRALTLTTGKRSAGYLVFDSPLADLLWSGN